MPKSDPVLEKFKAICLALPDTKLTMPWGKPHFRVGERIFAGCGEEGGWYALTFRLEKPHAARLVKSDPRFRVAPYIGKQGGVQMDSTRVEDWEEVRALVHESYGIVAGCAPGAKKAGKRRKARS